MKRILFPAVLAAVFALGLGIRLYDLTDPPFDFHATRQFRAALIARGMFYEDWESAPEPERSIAIAQGAREARIEPPILEWLASRIYLLTGGPQLWIPRALSSVFWILGGAAVYGLAKDLTSRAGALISLIYYLFLPFGMIASRSFQPDPLMAALIAGAAWSLYRWSRSPGWWTSLCAGAFSGLAILTKGVAVFPLGLGALFLIVSGPGVKRSVRDLKAWLIAGTALLPVGAYYINGLYISGFLQGQDSFRFFPRFWSDPAFYIRWVETAGGIFGFTALLAGLAGIALVRGRPGRALLAGMWVGYILYSLVFPFHTLTHDYYQLLLAPIAAVSLSPPADLMLSELMKRPYARPALIATGFLIAGAVLFKVWDTRVILARVDHRIDAAEWSRFEGLLPEQSAVFALTQAYGFPLAYYGWITAEAWPTAADFELRTLAGKGISQVKAQWFQNLEQADYFIVTHFKELERQPELRAHLEDQAEIYRRGEGYLIYDLNP